MLGNESGMDCRPRLALRNALRFTMRRPRGQMNGKIINCDPKFRPRGQMNGKIFNCDPRFRTAS